MNNAHMQSIHAACFFIQRRPVKIRVPQPNIIMPAIAWVGSGTAADCRFR